MPCVRSMIVGKAADLRIDFRILLRVQRNLNSVVCCFFDRSIPSSVRRVRGDS